MISKIIASRRAVYPAQYNSDEISKEAIEEILASANWAPTHRRTEPWRFKVFHTLEAKSKVSDFLATTYKANAEKFSEITFKKYQENPLKAACIIAVCYQRDPKATVPEWEEIAATAMAVQNMWLTASEMNIGAYWSTPSVSKYFSDYFEMGEGVHCLGFFYMGNYDGPLPEGFRNTSIDEKTVWM